MTSLPPADARASRRSLPAIAVRWSLRLAPTETQRVFALTLAIGALCGLAAVMFHLAIHGAEHLMIDRAASAPGWRSAVWVIVTPTLGGLAAGVLLQYGVPAARGSGIPQVKYVFAVQGGRLRFRDAMGKFVVAVLQIGSGASLGREGPTVQICAGIASTLGRFFAISPASLRRLIPVGAAAGVAAAFNAPIAAVTFTIEEIVGDLDQTVLSGVVVAAALAAVVERTILGEHPVFEVPTGLALHHASSLVFYAALGVTAGFVSLVFSDGLLDVRAWFARQRLIPGWAHPGVGGLATGVLAVVALQLLGRSGVTGGGYETLGEALDGHLGTKVLLALCVLKLGATVMSYASGGAGGIFAPALFVGGMLGGAVGALDVAVLHHGHEEIGAFALVGMGAVFAGVIRAPITSVLIIFEMTGSYSLILPLMIANATSYVLARHFRPVPIYEALLEQDGIRLPHRGVHAAILDRLTVRSAMTPVEDLVALDADATVADAVVQVAAHDFGTYPVLTGGRFVGLVNESRLRRTGAETPEATIGSVVTPRDSLGPDDPLVRAMIRMTQLGIRQLPVVAQHEPDRLLGLVTMSDVVRAQGRAAVSGDSHDSADALVPDPPTGAGSPA